MKLYLASLGCAKNLVDSDVMQGRLRAVGWAITEDPAEATVIVINTCSFIEPAINESIDTILELAELKKSGSCQRLIVVGCLPQRFGEEIADALPEVDMFLGTGAFDQIVQAVASETGNLVPDVFHRGWKPCPRHLSSGMETLSPTSFIGDGNWRQETRNLEIETRDSKIERPKCLLPDPNLSDFGFFSPIKDVKGPISDFDTPIENVGDKSRISGFPIPPMAYIKIAEGCSRHCTYCIIPKLRGRQRSRPVADILAEARLFVESGTRELVLVAQETTNYGTDLPKSSKESPDLSRLLCSILAISEDIWVRFLYGHPETLDETLIRTIAAHRSLCPYFDIPIQHASDALLKRMGRNYSRESLCRLFDEIRSLVPDASLRTSVITGFPGERTADFETLMRFVEHVRFDHLGVFIYSDAADLPSHRLPNPVPETVATERHDRLMSRQSELSLENNQRHVGRVLRVLIEEEQEPHLFVGRTAFQAPEVDGITHVHARRGSGAFGIGDFVNVRISDALTYDLIGEVT